MNIRTRDETGYHTREMLIDEQVVCWLTVVDHTIRIGSAELRLAGIAGVETHRQHRMKGYMRVLFEDTLQYMQVHGYDISMLFGIPDFYHKFGYATCLAQSSLIIQTRNAELARADTGLYETRPVTLADMPAIVDLYNRHNATRSCSLVRAAEHYTSFTKGSQWGLRAKSMTLVDGQGCFAGYAVWDETDLAVNVIEIESADETLYPALLYEFSRQAIEKRCGYLSFCMPTDHPFAVFAQRFGCEWTVRYPRREGGMMRIVNQAGLFDKIKPALQQRIAASYLNRATISIALRTELGMVTLSIDSGTLNISYGNNDCSVELSQDKLVSLVAGYRNAVDVLNDPSVHLRDTRSKLVPLLSILFPMGIPYLWLTDEF